jgi:hypothetical protein
MTSDSLKTQLRAVKTGEEVQTILSVGNKYEYVTGKTRRQWAKVAAKRVAQLQISKKK